MEPFFSSSPQYCDQNLFSVRNVMDELTQFNIMTELNTKTGSVNTCKDSNKAALWRKYVREAVVNCAGTPVELDFFEKIAGGRTEVIPAKEMTFKQTCDFDRNIVAKASVTAPGPGQRVTFQLHRSQHSLNGTSSYPAVGWEIYIYDDMQYVRVMSVNTDVPYAHTVTVSPKNKKYTISIRGGRKMMVSPATQSGGYTCNTEYTGTHMTPGYFYKMNMLRLRVQWKQLVDLQKGYQDVLQFGIMFDNDGNEIDCWEYYKKTIAREQLKYAFNLQFFTGQKLDNPDITNDTSVISDTSYSGFDGYVPSVMNAGGTVYRYDPSYGIDPYADFAAILMKQDALKRQKEWTMLSALPFDIQFDRNFGKVARADNGACTFQTFVRMGNNQEDIKRLGINSLYMWNMTIHRKTFDTLSDERSIGNGDFPLMAFMMPSSNLKDSNGRAVPPMEFFTNKGCGGDGQFEEHNYDARDEKSGCEEVGGWMAKTVGMVTHCLRDHIIMKPRKRC